MAEKGGRVIRSVSELNAGDGFDLIMSDGTIRATVNIKKEN